MVPGIARGSPSTALSTNPDSNGMHTTRRPAPRPSAVFRHEGSTPGPAARSISTAAPPGRTERRQAGRSPSRSTALKYYRAFGSDPQTDRRRSDDSRTRSECLICERAFGCECERDVDGAFNPLRCTDQLRRASKGLSPDETLRLGPKEMRIPPLRSAVTDGI
jgi:hypothetical protein